MKRVREAWRSVEAVVECDTVSNNTMLAVGWNKRPVDVPGWNKRPVDVPGWNKRPVDVPGWNKRPVDASRWLVVVVSNRHWPVCRVDFPKPSCNEQEWQRP
jgi:hypothetical protein